MVDHVGPELQAGESDSSEGSRKPWSLCEQEKHLCQMLPGPGLGRMVGAGN